MEPSATPATGTGGNGVGQIRIEGSGFYEGEFGVRFGVVLRNASTRDDAYDVAVTVNLLDEAGNTVATTESRSLSLIPAGET